MKTARLRIACLLIAAVGSTVLAQSNQGSITGTVNDQSGAVVPSAPIELRNTATGAITSSGATATGNFVIPVPAGTYEMSVSVPGFKKFVQTGIPVVDGAATRRDIQLEIGQVSDVITVTDTAPLLKTESGDVTYRVQTELVNKLPVLTLGGATGLGNIRDPLAMSSVLPGVQYGLPGFQSMVVNGLPANSQTIMIDGQDASPTLWRGVSTSRSQGGVDAIETLTMQTSNFAAEFGKTGGGLFNYTMKSGTNAYHGSAYSYFVNEVLHAGTPNTAWFDQSNAANNFRYDYKGNEHVRNRQRRNDYGFTLGGPIDIPKIYDGHNKSFFFFNFEQFRENQTNSTSIVTVPTLAYRQGDFTSAGCGDYDTTNLVCRFRQPITLGGAPAVDPAGNQIINGGIYDPTSYRVVNGFATRSLYVNQRVPLTSFDRVANNIQNLFPLPTNANLTNNYNVPTFVNWRRSTIPSIKLDHNISSTQRISGYWGQTITNQPNANGFEAEQFPWTGSQFNAYRNHTVRVNYDYTIAPTLILHLGAGYYHQREPNPSNPYDQTKIGLPGAGASNAFPYANAFPTMGGLNSGAGGFSPGIGAGFDATAWEQKPTGNINLTWVKGNHTFKFGGDMTLQGYITHNRWRANGNFGFANAQTGNPWESGQPLNIANPTGFSYASFLLGQPNNLSLAQQTFTREGGRALAGFFQDNWKITRKLTLEYGLRYDFQTYLREQHGRHASADFNVFNKTVGLNGGISYEGSCGCRQSSNYPYGFGPRLNLAYQINDKTVFRAGFGVNYDVVASTAGNNFSVGDFYNINAPGYGITPLTLGLQGGNQFYKGNPFGNTEVVWPIFDASRLPTRNAGLLPPESPFSLYHPDSRPGRIMQWSIGMQREIIRDLVIDASYVGNRGAWFYSPLLDTMGMNSLAGGVLGRYGFDITNATDRGLLLQNIGGNAAAAARGITAPYAGFPGTQQVGQAMRPVPHWNTVNSYLGPNRGNTWYDSLQVQVTKRYSHNLDLSANVTYSHAMVLGSSAATDFFFSGRPQVTDPFNRDINKQLNQLTPPLKTVITANYTTPGIAGASGMKRALSTFLKDWTVSAVLQYQSGQLLTTPNSNNALTTQLRLNPAASGPAFNPWNYVAGSSFWAPDFDPNGDFDPRRYNPATPTDPNFTSVLSGGVQANGTCNVSKCAWTNPAAGQWGTTSPYLEGFRWRRAPSENFNFGRNFRLADDGRVNLNVRAEFTNILNRMYYNAPATANPLAAVTTQTQRGAIIPTGGYGVVNTFNGAGSRPRQGTIVVRLSF